MTRLTDCVLWIQAHKDFFLVIAALLSPFAAVFVGLKSSKRQATALLQATRLQICTNALRDYRQRNIEKLRDEIASEIHYVSQMRFKQQQVGLDNPHTLELVDAAAARRIRIRALQSAASSDQINECFVFEEDLMSEIRSKPAKESWGLEENASVCKRIDELGTLYLKVLEQEIQAATEHPGI